MAFETGNFAAGDGFDAVHAKLKAFALNNGWTADGAYPALNLTKGTIHAILNFDTTVQVDDTLKSGGALYDYRIVSFLSNTHGGSGNYPNSMTGFRALSNDFTGPYSRYWLFTGGANDPDYIYMVVQKANGNFSTYMVGRLDRKGIDHDGGEFIQGVIWIWWFPNGSGIPQYEGSRKGSDAFGVDHTWPGKDNQNYNLKLGDIIAQQLNPLADPQYKFIGPFNPGSPSYAPFYNSILPLFGTGGKPTSMESYGTFNNRWLGHIYWLGPNPVNGITPLFELPVAVISSYQEIGHYVYMGSYPGYRACSMTGRTEAEHVTFGSDEWIIFPIKRFQPYLPEPFATRSVTSGPYGHAFKINT